MTDLPVLRSRLTGTLTTPDDTDYTAGVDAFNSTIQHLPTSLVRQIGFALGPALATLTWDPDHHLRLRNRSRSQLCKETIS